MMINNTDNMTPMELMGPDVNASKRLYIEMAIAEAHRQGFTVDVIEFAPDVHPLDYAEDSVLSDDGGRDSGFALDATAEAAIHAIKMLKDEIALTYLN
jgi:hypothetical protein